MRKRKWLIALGGADGLGADRRAAVATTTRPTRRRDDDIAEETTSDDSSAGRSTPAGRLRRVHRRDRGELRDRGDPPGGAAAGPLCEQARDAYEACITDAEEGTPAGEALDLAVLACEDAADQATEALEAAV